MEIDLPLQRSVESVKWRVVSNKGPLHIPTPPAWTLPMKKPLSKHQPHEKPGGNLAKRFSKTEHENHQPMVDTLRHREAQLPESHLFRSLLVES